MLLILDSNEYIFTFGEYRKPSCENLFDILLATFPENRVRIPRTIIEEVKRNVTQEAFKEFMLFVTTYTAVDEDIFIPFHLGAKYESRNLKPSDALIAAFTEWTGADMLVSENRHCLTKRSDLPFRILTAAECLKVLNK